MSKSSNRQSQARESSKNLRPSNSRGDSRHSKRENINENNRSGSRRSINNNDDSRIRNSSRGSGRTRESQQIPHNNNILRQSEQKSEKQVYRTQQEKQLLKKYTIELPGDVDYERLAEQGFEEGKKDPVEQGFDKTQNFQENYRPQSNQYSPSKGANKDDKERNLKGELLA